MLARKGAVMEEMLSRCGFRCDLCLARRLNVELHPEDRTRLSDGWHTYFGFRIPPEAVSCEGCLSEGATLDTSCPVRPCAVARACSSCALCSEYVCDKLKERIVSPEEISRRIGHSIPEEDYHAFIEPYDNRDRLDEVRRRSGVAAAGPTTGVLRLRGHHTGCVVLEWATRTGDHPTVPAAVRRLETDPDCFVRLVAGPDDVCLPCPHWTGRACDRGFEELNRRKDVEFLTVLGAREGDALTVRELVTRLSARADVAFYQRVCAGCSPEACAQALTKVAREMGA